MKIEELKQEDEFYDVTYNKITKYCYLMLYPFKNAVNRKINGYHILINRTTEEPLRIYYKQLQEILDKNITNYEEAKKYRVNLAKQYLKYLESKEVI
jgi:hypothetical protein